MSKATAPIASPCNSVCRIDERTGLCEGCYRTLDEIAGWSAMVDKQKLAVRDLLRLRRREARLISDASAGDAAPP